MLEVRRFVCLSSLMCISDIIIVADYIYCCRSLMHGFSWFNRFPVYANYRNSVLTCAEISIFLKFYHLILGGHDEINAALKQENVMRLSLLFLEDEKFGRPKRYCRNNKHHNDVKVCKVCSSKAVFH